MKKYLKYFVVLFILLAVLIFVKIITPDPLDWTPSYSKKDKMPFGNYILYDILPELFPGEKITMITIPPYNLLEDNYYWNTNYIFINQVFEPDEPDTESLLNYAAEGNNIFIAALAFSKGLMDTLKFKTAPGLSFEDSSYINFTDSLLKSDRDYRFSNDYNPAYFSEYDTSLAVVLGQNKNRNANFIVLPFGEGRIFLSSMPYIFTNYNLLEKGSSEYILKALSCLPVCDTFWDEYYKTGSRRAGTPLRFILSEESLRWAYYILLISVIIFIIFRGKRKQRIIPVIKPLANTTVGFIRNISNLYFEQKDHKNIADKKIAYFYDFIRSRYFIKKNELNEETFKKLSEKSGIDIFSIRKLFNHIRKISEYKRIREAELVMLHQRIQKFYKHTGYHGRTK